MEQITVFTVFASVIIMVAGTVYMLYLMHNGRSHTPPAAFIVIAFSFILASALYMQNPNWTIAGNIGLLSATACTIALAGYQSYKSLYRGRFLASFRKKDRNTILIAVSIYVLWLLTNDHLTSYILLQILAAIGYIPIMLKLWRAEDENEPFWFWLSIALSALFAMYLAFLRNDLEGYIYIARALVCTGAVVYLIATFDNRAKKHQPLG